MTENLAPGGSVPHRSEDLVLEEEDVVSSEDETDSGLERPKAGTAPAKIENEWPPKEITARTRDPQTPQMS